MEAIQHQGKRFQNNYHDNNKDPAIRAPLPSPFPFPLSTFPFLLSPFLFPLPFLESLCVTESERLTHYSSAIRKDWMSQRFKLQLCINKLNVRGNCSRVLETFWRASPCQASSPPITLSVVSYKVKIAQM